MPSWSEITQEIATASQSDDNAFDTVRRKYLMQLSVYRDRNVIAYYSGWLQRENASRVNIDDNDLHAMMTVIHGMDRKKGLDLILHTPGGNVAAAEAIGHYLRTMFDLDIVVIVPHLAMSAGTMLSCVGSEIVMGNHSSLGPIDPHFGNISTHGIMMEFGRAKQEIKEDPRYAAVWQPILEKYPAAFVGECENAMRWSKEIVADWLTNGRMFEGVEGAEITIGKIVEDLSNHEQTRSHSRHIAVDKCETLGLKIKRLESDSTLQDLVLSIHHAYIQAFSAYTNVIKIVENHFGQASITFE